MGIAVGAVIIGGAIFMFCMLIGSQSSADWSDGDDGGYGSSDWDASMFAPDDMGFEFEWLGPSDDGGSEPASLGTVPAVSARR